MTVVEVCPICDIAGCKHMRDRGPRPSLTFAPQAYPGGRILLMLGQHQIGAVFPPALPGEPGDPSLWRWSFWLNFAVPTHGNNKTEQAAKNALLTEARDWLRLAGVE